jgi:hypothetical protein
MEMIENERVVVKILVFRAALNASSLAPNARQGTDGSVQILGESG